MEFLRINFHLNICALSNQPWKSGGWFLSFPVFSHGARKCEVHFLVLRLQELQQQKKRHSEENVDWGKIWTLVTLFSDRSQWNYSHMTAKDALQKDQGRILTGINHLLVSHWCMLQISLKSWVEAKTTLSKKTIWKLCLDFAFLQKLRLSIKPPFKRK